MDIRFAGAPDLTQQAPTSAQSSGAAAFMQMLIMLLIFFAMMYFLVILPQRRREKEFKQMIESMKKGDTVITSGGIVGKIIDIRKDTIKIKSANNTELEVHKAYIAKVIKEKEEKETEKTEESQSNN